MNTPHYKDKEQLYNLIEGYSNLLREDNDNVQIDIMFVEKVARKSNPYKTWMFAVRNDDIYGMIIDTMQNAKHALDEREIREYDFELSIEETLQVIKECDVHTSELIRDAITIDLDERNTVGDSSDYNRFDFIVIQLSDSSGMESLPRLLLYKKHLKSPAKYKAARRFILNGTREAKLINKDLLVISSVLDAFCVDGNFYILNRNNFNSMMNFKDIYLKIIDKHKKLIVDSQLLDNPEEFIRICGENGRYAPRLSKAILGSGFTTVKNNKQKLKKLVQDYKLNIEFTSDGKIKYNKDTVNEVINLLLDHYVASALTSKKMLAIAIEDI